ncbi:MAG TPA: hypothetical protein VF789_29660 [Thermoanaerobaculia bacterium]
MDTSPGPLVDLPMDLSSLLRRGLVVSALALLALALIPSEVSAAEQEWNLGLVKSGGGSFWNRLFGRASDTKPPWAVEAPGAARARFGLGLDVFFEHQESLRFSFLEQTVRTRDLLTGGEEIGVMRTDPGLLNRKFDLQLELAGVGIQPAIALPSVGLPRDLRLYPTLVFQAASADVSLDFHDRTRAEDSSSLDGRGSLFGAGLDLATSLCQGCPWFTGASYRFQRLPSFTVDRSPPFGPSGFNVLEDEVRLSREVQEASARAGYSFSGNQVVSYIGVSHRWTDVEIEDHLRYRDPYGEVETTLDSLTRLDSETTLALAGVEARLGPRLFSRMETSVGDGDWGVLFRLSYLLTEPAPPTDPLYLEIAARIRKIRAEYLKAVNGLPEVVDLAVIYALLERTERKLLDALPFPKFAALHDSVRDRFQKIREALAQETAGAASSRSLPRFVPAVLSISGAISAEPVAARLATEPKSKLDALVDFLDLIIKRFENDDIIIKVCVKTSPEQGADVLVHAFSYDEKQYTTYSNGTVVVPRGLYAYRVELPGDQLSKCFPNDPAGCIPLDFLSWDNFFIDCRFNSPLRSCKAIEETSRKSRCQDP